MSEVSGTVYVVVWGKSGSGQRAVPVDEKYYGTTPDHAKDLARPLLTGLTDAGWNPAAVMHLSGAEADSLVEGDKPMLEIHDNVSGYDLDFVEVAGA
jgi:hypothetical protein